eukprot:TRINITY_DN3920_c1_g1_i1.p1 TRINITY_DN3920_c1_g1~~TRINITY_DN3920_c1_g1_i1.p1  ORF type:complete len:180 (-),score=23.73 TRINITY_DN3920_c1_g1_i1:220-759(-)
MIFRLSSGSLLLFYMCFTLGLIFLCLIPISRDMSRRMLIVQTQYDTTYHSAIQRIAYIEFIAQQLATNITGNPELFSQYYTQWRISNTLDHRLGVWKQKIKKMQKLLSQQDNANLFDTIELQQQLMDALKPHFPQTHIGGGVGGVTKGNESTWGSWLLVLVCMGVIGGSIVVLYNRGFA